ncbi:MAG: 16S rRNA (cytidine(1402)-2'-O)-methyltransferase [Mariprofundaceae bacterium]
MGSEHKRNGTFGQLFIVATPIGNLGDITFRAIETLKSVTLIAAEDTRISRRLLDHYHISTPMISYHKHNEHASTTQLLERIKQGEHVALISDAGTPLISDPGHHLVYAAQQQDIRIIPIPGACSPIAALSASGMMTERFTFFGFLPRSGRARTQSLAEIAMLTHVAIILESPKRLMKTLQVLTEICGGDRNVCVAREITKIHETFLSATLETLTAADSPLNPRGEIVLIIAPSNHEKVVVTDMQINDMLQTKPAMAFPPAARAKYVAKMLDTTRSRVYALLSQQSDT